MGLGDSIRALKIVSRAKGWDPDVIQGGGSIAPFNVVPDAGRNLGAVGEIPGGPPAMTGSKDPSEGGSLGQSVTFDVPDAGRETKNRATRGANPFPGGITGG